MYLDGLLQRLHNSGAGCYIGYVFVGALAYTDDVALLALTANAMRKMLRICESYGSGYSVTFNASKSVWLFITRRARSPNSTVQFYIDGKEISLLLITLI